MLVNGLPAARIGDLTTHGGVIVSGFPTVLIGDVGPAGGGGAADGGAGAAGAAPAAPEACLVGASDSGASLVRGGG